MVKRKTNAKKRAARMTNAAARFLSGYSAVYHALDRLNVAIVNGPMGPDWAFVQSETIERIQAACLHDIGKPLSIEQLRKFPAETSSVVRIVDAARPERLQGESR